LERLVNAVLQSSKMIKNQTALSGGTVSVSFAAVQLIRQKIKKIAGKKILLLGTGKIGRNTCKNLVDYLHTKHITLINRTEDKAIELAAQLGLHHAPVSEIQKHIYESDIILVATNSTEPAILYSNLQNQGEKLIIDLSMPCNVEQSAASLPNITLVNVDELSKLKDETLQKREAEIPAVKAIIHEQLNDFIQWYQMRKHVPVLTSLKMKLQEINTDPFYLQHFYSISFNDESRHREIQKVLNGMAVKLRGKNQYGCYYIQAINEFLTAG
jgi:glutamyl-tRNA reductase